MNTKPKESAEFLVILVGAIVAFVLYFREQKNLEQKQKETQLAVKA